MITNYTLTSAVNFPVAISVSPTSTSSIVGQKAATPYTISLSSEDINPHTIYLYARGSNSSPYQLPRNKWSHLIPQWRFVDSDSYSSLYEESTHVLSAITPTATSLVLDMSGNTIGMTASAEVYFIDDLPAGNIFLYFVVDFSQYPTFSDTLKNLQATVGYANSKVATVVTHTVSSLEPTHIKITKNGIDELEPYYWEGIRIPFVATVHGNGSNFACSTAVSAANYNDEPILFDVPITNATGSPIIFNLVNADNTKTTWVPSSSICMSAFDVNFNRAGGFVVGDVAYAGILPNTRIAAALTHTVSAFSQLDHYYWVANGENNSLNRITYKSPLEAPPPLDGVISYDLTYLQITAQDNILALTGFNGIYGLAKDPCSNIWALDAESDKLYKFNSSGILLTSINFADIGYSGGTPAGISFDSNLNAWITFFDSTDVIKLDVNGNFIQAIAPAIPGTIVPDPTLKPILAEPDRNNNVWVSYANPLCCALFKYNNIGTLLTTISLPTCSTPMDIVVDRFNDIWVSLAHFDGPPYLSGNVIKINTTNNTIVSSFSAANPEYIALDIYNSLWFTASANSIYKYLSTGAFSTVFSAGTAGPLNDENYGALNGLCTDVYGRVFAVNGYDNTVYIYDLSGAALTSINILPNAASGVKSAQAFGDWSGYKWYTKYIAGSGISSEINLRGSSSLFDIEDFSRYGFRRFNESWDASTELQNMALPAHIHDNQFLWKKYMDALIGNEDSDEGKAFGRQSYERTANYTQNHSDIDTCNINQLYGLASETDVPIDDYMLAFPPELRRIMDVASVNQQKLWGSRCKCGMNLDNEYRTYLSGGTAFPVETKCSRCGHYHQGNRGDAFSPFTYIVTAFVPFVIKDKVNQGDYTIISPPLSTASNAQYNIDPCSAIMVAPVSLSTYPLSATYNWLLPNTYLYSVSADPNEFTLIASEYCFYDYVAGGCEEQVAGLINWSDSHTTLDETLSTTQAWYGEHETLEKMISYVLYKGIGLIQ